MPQAKTKKLLYALFDMRAIQNFDDAECLVVLGEFDGLKDAEQAASDYQGSYSEYVLGVNFHDSWEYMGMYTDEWPE